MKYLLDEHVPKAVAQGLNRRNIKTYTIADLNRRGLSDPAQLEYAMENDFVIVTFDSDFLIISENVNHNGIIFVTRKSRTITTIIREILLIDATIDSFKNKIEFI